MLRKIKSFFSQLSDNTKSYFIMWWFAGAVYYFVAWGTNAGQSEYPFDLIFFLGLGMAIATILLINPIIYHTFTIRRGGKIANKKYFERTVLEGIVFILFEIFKAFFINVLIFLTYQALNQLLILAFSLNPERVVIPGEPILYATFYVLYYSLFVGIGNKISEAVMRKEMQNEE